MGAMAVIETGGIPDLARAKKIECIWRQVDDRFPVLQDVEIYECLFDQDGRLVAVCDDRYAEPGETGWRAVGVNEDSAAECIIPACVCRPDLLRSVVRFDCPPTSHEMPKIGTLRTQNGRTEPYEWPDRQNPQNGRRHTYASL
jgi:hypothetical protein